MLSIVCALHLVLFSKGSTLILLILLQHHVDRMLRELPIHNIVTYRSIWSTII